MDDEAQESADLTEIRIENLLKENAALRQRVEKLAKLARCVEALELALELFEDGMVDFKKYKLKKDADIASKYLAALAAAKGGK